MDQPPLPLPDLRYLAQATIQAKLKEGHDASKIALLFASRTISRFLQQIEFCHIELLDKMKDRQVFSDQECNEVKTTFVTPGCDKILGLDKLSQYLVEKNRSYIQSFIEILHGYENMTSLASFVTRAIENCECAARKDATIESEVLSNEKLLILHVPPNSSPSEDTLKLFIESKITEFKQFFLCDETKFSDLEKQCIKMTLEMNNWDYENLKLDIEYGVFAQRMQSWLRQNGIAVSDDFHVEARLEHVVHNSDSFPCENLPEDESMRDDNDVDIDDVNVELREKSSEVEEIEEEENTQPLPPSKFDQSAERTREKGGVTISFEDWLVEMEQENAWKEDCPVKLENMKNLKECGPKQLKEYGKAFNEEIIRVLGGKPNLPEKPGKKRMEKDPVYLFAGSTDIAAFRQRIQIACKSFHNITRNLNAMGQLLEDKQQKNREMRRRLKKCFTDFEEVLQQLRPDLVKLLALDENMTETIEKHKVFLDDDACPIIVSGQVSSGKSSLLNLFLGAGSQRENKDSSTQETCEDPFVLPVSTLACTGRVCEISYGEKPTAKIKKEMGDSISIELDELGDHVDMHGKEEEYKADDKIRDVVQLGLPIPFLKGGITLIDTPGVGENERDSKIVKDYVESHNVFGFIFTIHTSAGGGTNEKFQQLLRDMSRFKDDNGNKKLDPESAIFVCNFWDQITTEKDQKDTKNRVINILKETGFMNDFDTEKQLFFMNSKGAYDTWKVGYVSEDYDKLINGMERFFEIGHKRKLMQSYVWFHTLMERVLRSIKFLQFWARNMEMFTKSVAHHLNQSLDDIERNKEREITKLRKKIPTEAKKLVKKLQPFMEGNRVFKFTKEDTRYLEEFKDTPEIQEYKMDELIDKQITAFLSKWESDYQNVNNAKKKLEEAIAKTAVTYDEKIDDYEISSLSAEKAKDLRDSPFKRVSVRAGELLEEIKKAQIGETDMKTSFGRAYGNTVMKGSKSQQRMALGGNCLDSRLARMKVSKISGLLVPMKKVVGAIYQWNDVVKYLTYRAEKIYGELCSPHNLEVIMDEHMQPIEDLVTQIETAIDSRIHQNKELIKMVNTEMDSSLGTPEQRTSFFACGAKLLKVFDELLKLGYEANLEDVRYGEQNMAYVEGERILHGGIYGPLHHANVRHSEDKQQLVTVKVMKNLTESEQFWLRKLISKLNDERPFLVAPFLGLCEKGYGMVFSSNLLTAQDFFLGTVLGKSCSSYMLLVKDFLMMLVEALIYLHKRELVTKEISLNSVLVEVQGEGDNLHVQPLLSNISEKGHVKLPQEQEPTGNYIYLPYEVVQAQFGSSSTEQVDTWYTSAADMYGLAIITLELWHRADFLYTKKTEDFGTWSKRMQPGMLILLESEKYKKDFVPQNWLDLCKNCMMNSPKERVTSELWKAFVDKFYKETTV